MLATVKAVIRRLFPAPVPPEQIDAEIARREEEFTAPDTVSDYALYCGVYARQFTGCQCAECLELRQEVGWELAHRIRKQNCPL